MDKIKIKKLIAQMTLEEKASLLSGLDFWHTKPVERLGIPSIMMSDGPHGLRKMTSEWETVKSTCFPTASLLACSFDRELAKKQGEAIGDEAQAENVCIVLGPGTNIKRSPLCGRNFEYFSEDPFLSSRMAKSVIDGIQSKGIGTSLKHFCANNQETDRLVINENIDERTLREIYLSSFEYAVEEGKPTTVMCSYNKVNGDYTSQSKWLLTDLLRGEWGFDGLVMSDWGAVDNRPKGVAAGLDLEMPGSFGKNDAEIVKTVRVTDGFEGENPVLQALRRQDDTNDFSDAVKLLSEKQVDIAVERVLTLIYNQLEKQIETTVNYDKHHEIAAEVAQECMVLLKNDGVLPLDSKNNIALIGEFAKNPRYQGSGSSRVNSVKVTTIFDAMSTECEKLSYADGYSLENDTDMSKIDEAVRLAEKSDVAVIVAGLPDEYESEGYDRTHLRIPPNHIALIEAVYKANKNLVLVLCNGSAVEMPFKNSTNAILEAYLGGQAGGIAVSNILLGKANPCGKLAETFPKKLEHNPSFLNYPGNELNTDYREGLYVGYRWYDKTTIEPEFEFGFGLSYTSYEYSDIKISQSEINDSDKLLVTVKVKNTGIRSGKEIVQLYVSDKHSVVSRPEKELKGFEKISLNAGEEGVVSFMLDKRSFAYYDVKQKEWVVESGNFEILIGASCKDIRLTAKVKVDSSSKKPTPITMHSELWELRSHPKGLTLYNEIIEKLKIENYEDRRAHGDWIMLRNCITMMGLDMELAEMQSRIDEINS